MFFSPLIMLCLLSIAQTSVHKIKHVKNDTASTALELRIFRKRTHSISLSAECDHE
jgi:hypothetical protein